MEEKLVYENTFGDHLNVEGAMEHFYDSFPSKWGQIVDDYDEGTSHLDNSHEGIVVMENGMKLRIEIFLDDDAEDNADEAWICKAYEIIKVEEILVQGGKRVWVQ
ncbi:hypothetical protein J7E43_05640 [Bacillus sp. ISL-8]|nr:hypothetical protein [Bacillus sp. ISL-8]